MLHTLSEKNCPNLHLGSSHHLESLLESDVSSPTSCVGTVNSIWKWDLGGVIDTHMD